MMRRDRRGLAQLVWASVVGAALLLAAWPAAAQSVDDVSRLMSQWQIAQAGEQIEQLEESQPGSPGVQFVRARYDFLQGRYDAALSRLDQLLHNTDANGEWQRFRNLVSNTKKVTQDYEKYTSESGRFEIYVEPGKDRVLIPYAMEALEAAYESIGEELGHKPPTPIRVEVYPRTSTLAKVSGLTDKEIRTSGTIALCKYNRLMITSPKALLQGYGWVDTLIHEYIHFVINSKTSNRVPIWMHEGLAKFLEHRWRGPEAHHLPPSSEHLLAKRVEKDDLITFEQMHPSMAKLPSQEDAATAFAEVYTVMEYLHERIGKGSFRKLLEAVNETGEAKSAFERVVGKPFGQFDREWRAYLRQRPRPETPEDYGYQNKLVFKDEQQEGQKIDELDQPEAKDHMKLGEMLQAKGRFEAAVVQYRKAVKATDKPNPRLRTRLAQALTETGHPAEALEVLEPARQFYPSYVTVWLELGKASLGADRTDKAIEYLLEAARINPFDPAIHEHLAEAYEKSGEAEAAARERKFAQLVR
jgi:tetratricopeptide (TPR) repeat protein